MNKRIIALMSIVIICSLGVALLYFSIQNKEKVYEFRIQ